MDRVEDGEGRGGEERGWGGLGMGVLDWGIGVGEDGGFT